MHPEPTQENSFAILLAALVIEVVNRIDGSRQLITHDTVAATLRSAPTYTILQRQRVNKQQALWDTIMERAAQRIEIEELTRRLKDRGTVINTQQTLLDVVQGQRDALADQVKAADSTLLSVAKIALASTRTT